MPKKEIDLPFDFEKSLTQLEKIVALLEDSSTDLDKSLENYELGIKVYKECQEYLDKAEKKITTLTESLNK